MPHWRRWAKLRTQLYPYLAAADAEYRRTGMPIMRHLALAYPADPRATGAEDEFLFGPDLLAAPVLDPGRDRRSRVPAARRLGGLVALGALPRERRRLDLGRAHVIGGGRTVTVPGPARRAAADWRAPARCCHCFRPHVDTLASYGHAAPAVSVFRACRPARAARVPARALLGPAREHGGGLWSREERGRLEADDPHGTTHRWALQASLGTLRRKLAPCEVRVDGRRLRRRAWSAKKGVLRDFASARPGRSPTSRCSIAPAGCPAALADRLGSAASGVSSEGEEAAADNRLRGCADNPAGRRRHAKKHHSHKPPGIKGVVLNSTCPGAPPPEWLLVSENPMLLGVSAPISV